MTTKMSRLFVRGTIQLVHDEYLKRAQYVEAGAVRSLAANLGLEYEAGNFSWLPDDKSKEGQ